MEECIFDYIASHIECRFNKKIPPPVLLFSDFADWVGRQTKRNSYIIQYKSRFVKG